MLTKLFAKKYYLNDVKPKIRSQTTYLNPIACIFGVSPNFLRHKVNLWKSISRAGTSSNTTAYLERSITLSNQMSFLFIALALVLLAMVIPMMGVSYSTWFILAIIVIFGSIPILNSLGKTTFSRVLLSFSIPSITLLFSILTKQQFEPHVADYIDVRILILVGAVVPPIIFTVEEKGVMWSLLGLQFLAIALFDPIHTFFGVGYVQSGFQSNHYYMVTVISVIGFLFQILTILALKRNVQVRDEAKEKILEKINQQNKSLIENNVAIERQKSELQSAKNLIEEQTVELSRKNQELELLVNEKTRDLLETNNELIQYNNELRQFSYTISHNLRAPVASLIGLTNIIDMDNLNDDNKLILDHIQSSSKKLDNVFIDLNKIIDLRNSIGGVKEKIEIESELRQIQNSLENEITNSKATFVTDLQVPIIYSIRPLVNSILYNLISNAIKYKAKNRNPVINVRSIQENDDIKIMVSDNGIGLDTHTFREDIFKMYKRFHQHTEGKGLGLYLVKLQAESLGGKIEVESKVNVGSTFTLTLPLSVNVEDQTVMETDYFRVFYDAYSNTTGIIWKRNVSDEEYREAFIKNLEIFRQFKTPHWISSMNGIEPASPKNQQWLITSVVPDAIEYGLKKLAVVLDQELSDEYHEYVNLVVNKLKPLVMCGFFKTMDEAKAWIGEEESQ